MKGTRPLDNDDIRNLGLEGGLNFRWQYRSWDYPIKDGLELVYEHYTR